MTTKQSIVGDLKIKIVFVIPSLRSGGAERVMSFLASKIDTDRFLPHLLVVGTDKEVSYSIEGVSTTFLHKKRVSRGITSIMRFLSKTRPDLVISAIAHLNAAMAIVSFFFPNIKFIGRETSIASLIPSKKKIPSLPSLISLLVPKRLHLIVCQSNDMKYDLRDNLGYPERKLVVINNPINSKFKVKEPIQNSTKQFITVGRLVELKGHVRILRALSKIEFPFHYTIIGDGPEMEKILMAGKELNLEKCIIHIPFSDAIEKHLSKSDLFLQGSYSEGFPNALLESCAVGTPVLAFTAPGGTSEIIEKGVNGLIAKDERDFIEKLGHILDANWSPEQVSKSVRLKYNEEKILADYENMFIALNKNNFHANTSGN